MFLQISSNSRNLLQPLYTLLYTVKEKGGKTERKPHPLPSGVRNPYRNLRSANSQDYAHKNLEEIVRS
jgi:rRNA maturation protein Nop10